MQKQYLKTARPPLRGEGAGGEGFIQERTKMKRRRARSLESIEFACNQRSATNELADNVWQWIRNRKIDGAKLRREYPIPT
jgi:very-short-patch-repair endonuclease